MSFRGKGLLPPPPPPPPVELGDEPDGGDAALFPSSIVHGADDDKPSRYDPVQVLVMRRVMVDPPDVLPVSCSISVQGGSAAGLLLLRLVDDNESDDLVRRGDETGGTNNVLGDEGVVAPLFWCCCC